ncbi:MAG: RNA-binding S4 domain-containing protein [Magnetospiraceae bacterium]
MTPPSLRLDKWLWHARFFKSRTLASKFCAAGKLRLNGDHLSKAHALVREGDVLTFPLGPHVRIIRVVALGTRRGPAPEAQALYDDLDPPQPRPKTEPDIKADPPRRDPGAGRPTKRDRRQIDHLKGA